MNNNSKVRLFKENPTASRRMFCFPFAGGSASAYKDWGGLFFPEYEISIIQIPGRETRIKDTLLITILDMVNDLYEDMLPYLNKPYDFFGHSMGALIGYELIIKLQNNFCRLPDTFFVSACAAPHIPAKEMIHNLPDKEFKEKMIELGGTPPIILENPELFDLFGPIIRADFQAVETYLKEDAVKIASDIVAYGGREDREVLQEDLKAWKEYTSCKFSSKMFQGSHFFLYDELSQIVNDIKIHTKEKVRRQGW